MHAFLRTNFGTVAGEGMTLLFNTKDFSLFLCAGEFAKELTITGSKIGGQRRYMKNSFTLGKIVLKRIFSIEVPTKALLQSY